MTLEEVTELFASGTSVEDALLKYPEDFQPECWDVMEHLARGGDALFTSSKGEIIVSTELKDVAEQDFKFTNRHQWRLLWAPEQEAAIVQLWRVLERGTMRLGSIAAVELTPEEVSRLGYNDLMVLEIGGDPDDVEPLWYALGEGFPFFGELD